MSLKQHLEGLSHVYTVEDILSGWLAFTSPFSTSTHAHAHGYTNTHPMTIPAQGIYSIASTYSSNKVTDSFLSSNQAREECQTWCAHTHTHSQKIETCPVQHSNMCYLVFLNLVSKHSSAVGGLCGKTSFGRNTSSTLFVLQRKEEGITLPFPNRRRSEMFCRMLWADDIRSFPTSDSP